MLTFNPSLPAFQSYVPNPNSLVSSELTIQNSQPEISQPSPVFYPLYPPSDEKSFFKCLTPTFSHSVIPFHDSSPWFHGAVSKVQSASAPCQNQSQDLAGFRFAAAVVLLQSLSLKYLGWDKCCSKAKYLSLAWLFCRHLSDLSSQMKVKNVPAYPLHFLIFSAFRDQYAASLSCLDISLFLLFTIMFFCSVMTQNRKLWKRSTYLFPSLLKVQLPTPTGNSRLLCEWMSLSYSGKTRHSAVVQHLCKVTWPK